MPKPETAANSNTPRKSESSLWHPIKGEWRQIFGSFSAQGISLEWHDITPDEPVLWEKSFHSKSLEICLNLEGSAELTEGRGTLRLISSSAAFYRAAPGRLRANRESGQRHRFVTIEIAQEYLAAALNGASSALHPVAASFLAGRPGGALGAVVPMKLKLSELAESLLDPPVIPAAAPVWYRAKILEILAEVLFVNDDAEEFFCSRQKRLSADRVTRIREIIDANLESPPPLKELAKMTGCSPFYLSRTFAEVTGTPLTKYIRRRRIEAAAELLRTGRCNVTEAAFSVGYSSLSHFSKSFYEIMGCCPGLYPQAAQLFQHTRGDGPKD